MATQRAALPAHQSSGDTLLGPTADDHDGFLSLSPPRPSSLRSDRQCLHPKDPAVACKEGSCPRPSKDSDLIPSKSGFEDICRDSSYKDMRIKTKKGCLPSGLEVKVLSDFSVFHGVRRKEIRRFKMMFSEMV